MNPYGVALVAVVMWWSVLRPTRAILEYRRDERRRQAFADLRKLDEQICASMAYRGCCDMHDDGRVK